MAAAGDVEKARDAVAGVEAERHFGQSETRAVGGDAEVLGDREHEAAKVEASRFLGSAGERS